MNWNIGQLTTPSLRNQEKHRSHWPAAWGILASFLSIILHQSLGQKDSHVTWQNILVTTIDFLYLPPLMLQASTTSFPEQLSKSGINCDKLVGRGCSRAVMPSVTYYCWPLNRISVEILPDHWKNFHYLVESIWIHSASEWLILISLCFIQRFRVLFHV